MSGSNEARGACVLREWSPGDGWPMPRVTHRRSVIDDARLCYEAHWEQMLLAYPHLRMTPWDDQDAAVREAWIEHATPDGGTVAPSADGGRSSVGSAPGPAAALADEYVEALVKTGLSRAEAERRVADQRRRGLLREPTS